MSTSDYSGDAAPELAEVSDSTADVSDLQAQQAVGLARLVGGSRTPRAFAAIAAQVGVFDAIHADTQFVRDSMVGLARDAVSRSALSAALAAFEDVAPRARVLDELAQAGRLALGDNVGLLARAVAQGVGDAALVGWTGSRLAKHHVWDIETGIRAHQVELGKHAIATVKALEDLKVVSGAAAGLTDWVLRQRETSNLLSNIGTSALDSWNRGLLTLQPEASGSVLRAFLTTGRASLGIAGTDILTSGEIEQDRAETAAEEITAEVLQPWESGRLEIARELRTALGRHDATLPDLLDGAWDDITRRGPAAAVKAANCAIEVMDRVLRAAAPDAAVIAWHASSGRPMSDWEDVDPRKAHPPHSMRVRYLMAGRDDVSEVVQRELDALLALRTRARQRLQAVKHASKGNVATVRALIMATENFLMSLFLED